MRILHTSDWHIGRTFFGHSTLDSLAEVFDGIAQIIADESIDVVVAAGDIFDLSAPSAAAVELLDEILIKLRSAGAQIVLTPGNHDSAPRLGARRAFTAQMGVHVLTDVETVAEPVTIDGVHFYGVPFLEPAVVRTGQWHGVAPLRSQRDAVGYALELIRTDAATRRGASVVLAHTFVQGADGESCDSERDIVDTLASGGVDKVPVSTFDGVTYAALGHIHGRATLAPHLRYSGAPLHLSFSEKDKPRGGWIVELTDDVLGDVAWVDFPIPRALATISGDLEDLLSNDEFDAVTEHWIEATITDQMRPLDAMKKLQARFPHCVHLRWVPPVRSENFSSYSERLASTRSDEEVIAAFLTDVRNGVSASPDEQAIVADVVAAVRAQEALA